MEVICVVCGRIFLEVLDDLSLKSCILLICNIGKIVMVIIIILMFLSYCSKLCYRLMFIGVVLRFVSIVDLVVVRLDIVLKKVFVYVGV